MTTAETPMPRHIHEAIVSAVAQLSQTGWIVVRSPLVGLAAQGFRPTRVAVIDPSVSAQDVDRILAELDADAEGRPEDAPHVFRPRPDLRIVVNNE